MGVFIRRFLSFRSFPAGTKTVGSEATYRPRGLYAWGSKTEE